MTGNQMDGPPQPEPGRELAEPAEPAAATGQPRSRRISPGVEALGYVGGIAVLTGGFFMAGVVVTDIWPRVPAVAELVITCAITAILLVAGMYLRVADQPVLGRLRAFLWFGSTTGVAVAAALLAGRMWRFAPVSTALFASVVALAWAASLWWRSRATLQEIAVFVAAVAAIIAGSGRVVHDPPPWQPGLGVWLLSLVWLAAAWRGLLAPRTAGYALSGLGLLTGAQLTLGSGSVTGRVFSMVTVAGLLAAGVALDRVLLLALGAIGALVMLPQVVDLSFSGNLFRAGLVILIAGCALLTAALMLAKTRIWKKAL